MRKPNTDNTPRTASRVESLPTDNEIRGYLNDLYEAHTLLKQSVTGAESDLNGYILSKKSNFSSMTEGETAELDRLEERRKTLRKDAELCLKIRGQLEQMRVGIRENRYIPPESSATMQTCMDLLLRVGNLRKDLEKDRASRTQPTLANNRPFAPGTIEESEAFHQNPFELGQTKYKLEQALNDLRETKGFLAQSNRELYETKKELRRTKEELWETKKELQETKEELWRTKKELYGTEGALSAPKGSSPGMNSSSEENQNSIKNLNSPPDRRRFFPAQQGGSEGANNSRANRPSGGQPPRDTSWHRLTPTGFPTNTRFS